MSDSTTEQFRDFYESWAELRTDAVEADHIWQACQWKWRNLDALIRRHAEPTSILEFGCGSGDMLELARGSFPQAELHGVDISDRMLELARARLGEVTLVRGSEESLEAFEPPVDLTLAIDILEHLVDPTRAARALGHAGKMVALKIPLERTRVRLGIQKRRVGVDHIAGHLHFWTVGDSRRMLQDAGLVIIDELVDDPPDAVRYHEAVLREEKVYPSTPLGLLRRAHRRLEVSLERFSFANARRLHELVFGTNHFVLARARD